MTNWPTFSFHSQTRRALGAVAAFAFLTAAPAALAQQSSQTDSWGSTDADSARTTSYDDRNQDDDYTGAYVQAAFSIGRIDWSRGIDSEASGGFTFGGGWRFLPWIAADANFQLLGGVDNAELGRAERDSNFFAFTFGPKVYPLGFFEVEAIPTEIQPYATIGIGGGGGEISGRFGGDRSAFIARFILGIDYWFTDHIGAYIEGGGFATDDGTLDGAGTFNFGASYRF